jgi:CBS domain-containing protein
MRLSDILATKGSEVVTIPQTAGIEAAAKVLRDRRFGALVVVDAGGKMAGILSERDIIRIVGDLGGKGLSLRVEDIMTRTVRTCKSSDSVEDMMQIMAKFRIRHVPVVDDGKLIGLVSQTDLIKQQLAALDDQAKVMKNLNIAKN